MSRQPIVLESYPPFAAEERAAAAPDLQGMVVDLVDLALLGKQAHWNVEGRLFRSLHLELDEFVDAWRSLGDEVAERAVAIGIAPDGQARFVAGTTEIEPLPAGPLSDQAVIDAFTERIAEVVIRTRERIHHASDPVTDDVFIRVAAALEKQLWMLRVQREGV